jgi:hypothetical protein
MPITVDRRPGAAYRETEFQVSSTGAATVVSAQGGLRYNGSAFQMLDALGQYDPRKQALLDHALTFDMPHLLAGGSPVLQGAFKTQTFYLGAFLNLETWWVSSAQTAKLSTHQFFYNTASYANPSQEVWTLFDGTAQNNILRRVTDVISYSGINETIRQRTIQ